MKMPKALRHAALVYTVRASSSPAGGSQCQMLGSLAVHVQRWAPAPPNDLRLIRERPTAILPGPMTVLYQIREELTSRRKCRSLPDLYINHMCFLYPFYWASCTLLPPPTVIMDITSQGQMAFPTPQMLALEGFCKDRSMSDESRRLYTP